MDSSKSTHNFNLFSSRKCKRLLNKPDQIKFRLRCNNAKPKIKKHLYELRKKIKIINNLISAKRKHVDSEPSSESDSDSNDLTIDLGLEGNTVLTAEQEAEKAKRKLAKKEERSKKRKAKRE